MTDELPDGDEPDFLAVLEDALRVARDDLQVRVDRTEALRELRDVALRVATRDDGTRVEWADLLAIVDEHERARLEALLDRATCIPIEGARLR